MPGAGPRARRCSATASRTAPIGRCSRAGSCSFTEIRARIRVPGAEYIGVEVLDGLIYRLKFMRGADVIWIDVDARTGRIVAPHRALG